MRSKPIRLAMVRCDGHAYTYGPLMARVDPSVFARNCFAEYYFMIDCYHPEKLNCRRLSGIQIVKLWDQDPQAAHGLAQMLLGKPEVCRTLEEMTGDVDAAFINCCNGDGSDHLRLASPFLKKGIPTFIDKPFAATLRDAVAIVGLARKHGAPLMSSSILAYVDEVRHLKNRFRELRGEVRRGVVTGVGWASGLGGIIHGISLGHAVFGEGVESVECMGEGPLEYLLMHYQDGREMLVINTRLELYEYFTCDVYSVRRNCPPEPAHLRSDPIGEPQFVIGAYHIARLFKRMVLTGQSPTSHSKILELGAILEAGRQAQKEKRRVYLSACLAKTKEKSLYV